MNFKTKKVYKRCRRCVMDQTTSEIYFNKKGICNFCSEFEKNIKIYKDYEGKKKLELESLILSIKKEGRNKRYDCIIGLSGGVDSSWVLHLAVLNKLRPLVVHMDNGWNSELAQNNIYNLITKLNVDFYTYIIDWEEYRQLMQAFFNADVIDIELLTDNALQAVVYKQAKKYGVKYILSGQNISTEGMAMPKDWNWFKLDKANIFSIAKKSKVKIKTFPAIGIIDFFIYKFLYKIEWVPFLDFFNYKKSEALEILSKSYSYKKYPYKHYESIFTRFYQAYILPEKFNVDKRLIHLSTLIMTNQISRDDALKDLQKIPYNSIDELLEDKNYFLKKMHWDENILNSYLLRNPVSHDSYKSERKLFNFLLYKVNPFLKKINLKNK